MSKFDPFAPVNCRYGAPMGRVGNISQQWDGESPLLVASGYAAEPGLCVCGECDSEECDSEECICDDGAYDKGGAYWGTPANVHSVYTADGDFCTYVRADSAQAALKTVMDEWKAVWGDIETRP